MGLGAGGEGLPGLAAVGGAARFLAVYHVGGDGEDGHGGLGFPIGGAFLQLAHEHLHHRHGDVVHPGIVVAEFGEVTLHLKIHRQAAFIPDGTDPGVFDGGQGIAHHRQARHAAGHGAEHLVIVQGHLQLFIAVFVMHIMDNVEGIYIQAGKPVADGVELSHDVVVFQIFPPAGQQLRPHLQAAFLIPAAVDGIKQRLGQIRPGAENCICLPIRMADTQQAMP